MWHPLFCIYCVLVSHAGKPHIPPLPPTHTHTLKHISLQKPQSQAEFHNNKKTHKRGLSGPQLPVLCIASACASDNDGNRYFATLKQQEGGAINRKEEGGGKDASARGEEEEQQQPFPEEKTRLHFFHRRRHIFVFLGPNLELPPLRYEI